MPVETRRQSIGLEQVVPLRDGEMATTEDGGFLGNIRDKYNTGWIGAMRTGYGRLLERNSNERRQDFDWTMAIPPGYEEYADAYAGALNTAEVDYITSRINSENASRAREAQNSTAANLGYGLIAGVFDPINLIGGPSLKGVGFLSGVSRGALTIGTVNAGTEVARHHFSPTSTIGETALNITFGYAVAGLIGGGIGHFTRLSPEVRGGRGSTANLTREQRATAEASGNNFARAVNGLDGVAVVDEIDFNGQGVRVIDGPTGKVDASGNPVRAFYRSKEVQAEYARRDRVRQASDDALGDVIPDERPDVAIDPGRFDEMAEESVSRMVDEADEASDAATPFGGRDGDGEPARGGGGEDKAASPDLEDTIYVDTAAVRASFSEKPWTRPRYEGIEALPEDAFKSEAEWLNFTVLHELHHATTPRLAGEAVAAYENRINTLALEDIQGGRLPLSPTDNMLEKMLLLPTPSGTLMRLAPGNRDVHGLAQMIAGDMSTLTVANRAGMPTTQNGSVFQRSQRWMKSYFEVMKATRQAYAKYVHGAASEGNFAQATDVLRARLPVVGGAARQGKLKLDEFNDYVGRAVFDDEPFDLHGKPLSDEHMVIVREAAGEIRKVLARFEKQARELGLFDRQRSMAREVAWRERAIARDDALLAKERRTHVREQLESDMAARRAEIDEMRATLDEMGNVPVRHRAGESFYSRIYDIAAVRERYDDFVDLIADGYARENGEVVSDAIRARAAQTADRIIGEGGEEVTFGLGTPRSLRSREIPLTNKELSDFIIKDPERVMGVYARRMGAVIEMERQFGSRHLSEQIDTLRSRLQAEKFKSKDIDHIVWEIEAMRDRVLGTFHGKDPLSLDNRAARAIKNFGSLVLMGRGIYSQMVDIARTVAAEGFSPLFKALHASVNEGMGQLRHGSNAREAGEALEMVMSRMMARMMEDDSAFLVTRQTRIERGLAAMQAPFFNANLMNPFTVMWKEFTSLMSGHRLVRDAGVLAEAVRAGRTKATFSPKETKVMAELASWGIDLRAAQMIADMPIEETTSGLKLVNLEAWDTQGARGARAREAFTGALSGTLRSNVVTPGPLQRAAIMDGVFRYKDKRIEAPLASLPFQLMSFTMSASHKIGHSLVSGRDRNRLVTMSSLLAGGYVATWLASGDDWDRMTWKEVLYESIDRSGLLFWAGDVMKRAEALSDVALPSQVGPRAAMGLYEFGEGEINDEVGALAGPSVGIASGVIDAFTSSEIDDRRRGRLLTRALAWNGLVWWDESLKDLSDAAIEAGLIDVDVTSTSDEEAAFATVE